MTGEVVTGTEERLATGDAVNVAARLEQAAQPGEVLIGQPTLALVRDAADVEPIDPLELKGKAEPVPAFRLLRVRDAPERRHGARFVGREHELALLREAWERVRAEQRCELVTVIGEAGVGKSRLAAEALGIDRGDGRPGPLPPLRRGDHILAGRRGTEAARRAASGGGRRGGDPLAARRDARRRHRPRRSRGPSARRWSTRRRSGRWWSSSTTSSGARRRSST